MSAAERALWEQLQRRARLLQPDVAADLLRAWERLAQTLSEDQMTAFLRSGRAESLIDELLNDQSLRKAFGPMRQTVLQGTTDAAQGFNRLTPGGREIGIAFDVLSPRVTDAIRQLDTRVMTTLSDQVRETVRQRIAAGLSAGEHPRAMARDLRDVIGLAPNQEAAVRNFRRKLEGDAPTDALDNQLRDRRFDAAIRKGNLTPERIDRMVDIYRKRFVAFNAETNARTAALDANKLGQKLAWEDAVARGDVDPARLMKRWVGVMDDRERPEHVAMEGEEAPYDQPFSNGQMIPGESDFNCRCIALYFVAKAAPTPALAAA